MTYPTHFCCGSWPMKHVVWTRKYDWKTAIASIVPVVWGEIVKHRDHKYSYVAIAAFQWSMFLGKLVRTTDRIGQRWEQVYVEDVLAKYVGNWLTGRDSNASRKKTEQQPETVAYATPTTSPNKLTGKMLGWITSAPIEFESDKASDALSQLPPALQEKARSIHQWLSLVLATEV